MRILIFAVLLTTSFVYCNQSTEKKEKQEVKKEEGLFVSCISSIYRAIMKPTQDAIADGINYVEEHGAGKEALKEVETLKTVIDTQNKAIATISSGSSETLKELTSINKSIGQAQHDVAQTNKETNNILKEGLDKLTKNENIDKAKKITDIASNSLYIADRTWRAVSYIYRYLFPSTPTKEEQLRQQQITKELEIIKAERSLNKCIAVNLHETLDSEGLPCNCKEEITAYLAAVGMERYSKLKEDFKKLKS